jgi:hypothetical protein
MPAPDARQLVCATAIALAVLALALALAPSSSVADFPRSAAVSEMFFPVKDTWVDSLHPTDTHGSANNLRVGSTSDCPGYGFRAKAYLLMQFNLSSIPRGSEVLKAELHLYQLAGYGDPAYTPTFQWWTADRDWPEDATASQVPLICGGVAYLRIDSAVGWKSFDITHIVGEYWVGGACPNFGFQLRSAEAPAHPDVCNGRVFGSREFYYMPYLLIQYRAPSPSPTVRVTASTTATATRTRTRTPTTTTGPSRTPTPTRTSTPTRTVLPAGPRRLYLPIVLKHSQGALTITLGQANLEHGLSLDAGGDADTEVVTAGSPALEARRTGNGRVLASPDGNAVEDRHLQLRADNGQIYAGLPTTRVCVEVVYLDTGGDAFELQYDALSGGPFGDGRFQGTGLFRKASTGLWKTAVFTLCDAYFANRDLGADLRISDAGDGPETIQCVTLTLLSPAPCP